MMEKLFTPVIIGDFTVEHRIALAPMTRCRADHKTQIPKEFVTEYYTQRASCQGLLITEATSIHEDAARNVGTPGIYSEEQVVSWSEVTKRVHQNRGKIFMQIWHTGRTAHSSLLDGKQPVSSSAVKIPGTVIGKCAGTLSRVDSEIPRVLREDEIPEIVNQYVTASENAIRAGFDGVEVHGANGYLVDQFLRDGVNQRTDSYGGSIEKRCKFALDIIAGMVEKIGSNRTAMRFSPFGTYNSMSDSEPVALYSYLFQKLNELHPDLAYIHVTDYSAIPDPEISNENRIERLLKFWQGKCILNLTDMTRQEAIEIIDKNKADLVSIGRDFVANPDLPKRLLKNLPLNKPDPTTFYTNDENGYTDYPFYKNSKDDIVEVV